MSEDVTNALPTAGVGNNSANAHTPKNPKEEERKCKKTEEGDAEGRLEHRYKGKELWVENPES